MIFDLEYTSWPGSNDRVENLPGKYHEIIQIGAVIIEMSGDMREVDSFQTLVRPQKNPILSDYLVDLTRITQEQVEKGGVLFPLALIQFMDFINGVRAAMKDCDAVLHLAALIAIPYSYHSPDTYIDTNIKGTLNIVQAARDLGVTKVVHTSTSEVYGTAQFVPITEDHPLQGQSPYSASKIGADQIAMSFFTSFDTPVAILRPFNTYGPRQSARAVIPTIITQIANGKKQIKLGALNPTRDFNYVSDTVAGFIAALKSKKV